MRFIFKESRLFEGGNPVDPKGREIVVKVPTDDEQRARRRLPKPATGRVWVLIERRETP